MTVHNGSSLCAGELDSLAVRPLAIAHGSLRVAVPVSTSNGDWVAAEIVREEFLHSISTLEPPTLAHDASHQDLVEAEAKLLADFLSFVAHYDQSRLCTDNLLLASLQHFTSTYLTSTDVHSFVAAFEADTRKSVLTSYFFALAKLEANPKLPAQDVPRAPASALLSAATEGSANIYGLFGGQGTNEVYFDELRSLYEIYKPYVGALIANVSAKVLVPLATKAELDGHSFYSYGLDVVAWLDGSAPVPPVDYLASIPISFPLIGLTQLVQYLASCRVSNLLPGDMRKILKGTTGHSQGIVSAVCIAASQCLDSFETNTEKALTWLFYSGLRGQEAFPVLAIDPALVKDSVEGGEGVPSPMLGVTGLALDVLEKHISGTNKYLPTNARMAISLYNGPRAFVVTGPARSLYGLVTSLRKIRAPSGLDQSKIPFSQRKAVFSVRFLTVGVPYHSSYLDGVTEKVFETDLQGQELWTPADLAIPVYHTEDGSDLRSLSTSLTKSLCDQIFTMPIHWAKATGFPETATHAVDFGPGGLSGIGGLTARNLDGRGVRVIIIGEKGKGSSELYSTSAPKYEVWWSKKYAPQLVKTADGVIHIDTPFSRLLGKPPIMVAGMTPTTVKAGFVSAVLSAGFHVELAGGGHYNAKALRAKVAEIQSKIPPGVGLTLNSLYINPRQFGFQLPLWQELRREGVPIEGFCVAAGIPSTEKAAEIISGLKAAGIKHVSFKPGSVEGIRQVVNIASANPDFPIILQWTGGRAGGHHSCEDFHQPVLQTYASIRQQANISLVAGSGFGGADDVWPYLTGQWSSELFGVQPMPFDGFLFASRVMVAKEAHTSESVKQLIVAASGVDDKDWEGTYTRETGGVLTVNSELGEPIHKIATRGVKLWKEFDDTVFKLPKDKRAAWLAQNKQSVIEKLNRDFAKPWFAQKKDGTVVEAIGEMTYEEVVLRMVRLMYVSHENRWVDISLRNLTGDFCRRVEERFSREARPSILQSYLELDQPHEFLAKFFKTYPAASEQLVASEDAAYFLAISQRPGQKPVPFIPVLDADFGVWFKKDSLWAAEDIEAVFDQDPQRVCILQGPVAVKHCVKANEPIKELLGNIDESLKSKLLAQYYGGDESNVPVVDYLGSSIPTPPATQGITKSSSEGVTEYTVGKSVPSLDAWLETLSGPTVGWLRALLTSSTIVQGKAYIDNPLRRLFAPREGQRVVIEGGDKPTSITLYGAGRSFGPHPADFEAVRAVFDASSSKIALTMNEERNGVSVPLELEFQYRPDQGFAPIHEIAEGRNKRIKDFYWRLWFGDDLAMPALESRQVFEGPETRVEAAEVERFCAVVRNEGEAFKTARNGTVQAPLDFAIVTGWQAIIQAIFPESIDGDLLKLVHLSNEFKMVPGATPLLAGDVCKSQARISSVSNTDAGKSVKVTGFVMRDGKPVIEVTSAFLYRGRFTDYAQTFDIVAEDDYVVEVETHADVAVLQNKDWFHWDDDTKPLQAGTRLIFRVVSDSVYHDKTSFTSVEVKGHAYVRNQLKELIQVATIEYSAGRTFGNPVVAYLQRHGKAQGQPVLFENGGYTLTSSATPSTFRAPSTNEPYSKISRDFNPIHVNPYFSDFANLPATITHGMWSSAATRKFVETVAAKGHPERVSGYNVNFVGMVIPGDELTVNLKHVGMKNGKMILKVTTTNQRGEKVLEGGAEVAQPATVYAFTGQGSQEPGMGMELYASSPAARAVWDTADEHLLAVYGFSIIDIVKNNPKTKTIHFGGFKGQAIRERYMTMSYDALDKDGNVKTLPLFADIDIRTPLYTFSHPNGLLFATQFAQIALVVTEKAAFEDMRSKGLIQEGCAFAGHSLGEYSALASIADVLAIPALVDVVFYRGITMQRAVERDSQNRSNYAMCAVNPSRIGKSFDDAALREVVDGISAKTGLLLQIVNFNVEGQQYVCAGELLALQTLTNVLNYLKIEKVDIAKLIAKFSLDKVKEMLGDITQASYEKALEKQKEEGFIKLERGFATIPLPGIDVPFHSRYLWAGVMPFRAYLSKKINASQLNPDMLVGQYVPNLIAEPFQVTLEYAQKIYDQTSSPTLEKIINNWESEQWGAVHQRQNLAYAILVELLAYQFASPVKWIQTQDIFFTQYHFERFVEIGPSPTLTGMATRTLKAKYEAGDNSVSRTRAIYCHAKNAKEIYYQFEDEPEAAAEETTAAESAAPAVAAVAAAPVAVAAPASSGPVAQIPDEPIKAVDILLVIIAQKLKKKVEEIPVTKAIKDLVGGKSTLQNEILGDLQAEFSAAPEKGEELPLDELGAALSAGHSGNLGKYSTGMISRLVGGKMPGGFNLSAMKAYLGKQWGLGASRADAAILLGVTLEPAKRLGSEPEAKAWLDTVAAAYAKQAGISLSSGGGGSGGAAGGGAVMNSEEFLKFKAEQEAFAAQHVELYMRHLGRDSRAGGQLYDEEKANSAKLQSRLDEIAREHGDTYISGVLPVFDPLKARHFDSAWNWVRQDALLMFYDIIFGRLTTVDREITARCIAIMNRADPAFITYMQYHIGNCDPTRGETYKLAKEFGQRLLDNCREAVGHPPLYKDVNFPTGPSVEVTPQGDIVYSEVPREDCRKMEQYVQQMSGPSSTAPSIDVNKLSANLANLWKLVQTQPEISEEQRSRIKNLYDGVVRSLHKAAPDRPAPRPGSPRSRRSSSQFLRPQIPVRPSAVPEDRVPLLHLKRKIGSHWEYSGNLTSLYLDVLTEIATSGTTFKDKNALLTGVGKGSIGVEIVKGLLSGGARVVITTSRYSRSTVEFYQDIYHRYGSDGSALTVVPFNQGSRQDVEALVDYIYTTLAMDLDYILPFAGIPENGREIDGLDDKSELAHRIMLTNLYRLMGAVKTKKASRNFVTRPTQVVLPLSPNHGLFGNDGLYPESKIALENLFARWSSESWGEYLCLAGAVIGWTRGTGLMGPTNTVAQQLETYGVRTFSTKEMAFNILGLMHPLLFSITQVEPIWADLSGAMDRPDLAELTTRIRKGLMAEGEKRKAISRDTAADYKVVHGQEAERVLQTVQVAPRANVKYDFPPLEPASSLEDLKHLRGLIDLDKVVVVTGFAEVGPWGGSRTRWEMEARGEFTIEGCIEMAWMMGYIKHHNGRLKNGELYVGWVDFKTGEPVSDGEVKKRYEKDILAHSGIRLIEPELFNGYDPKKKTFYQEIQLNHDLEPLEVSEVEARKFKLQHEDKCDIWTSPSGEWFVKLKKGARIIVPKSFSFDRLVAGQIPTGWSAGRYGLPDDIIAQVDRTALWALVCTAEALTMSGVSDPYELYKYVHPSEVGSSLGSGMGGTQSIAAMFKDRREEKDVQMDIFQETYINTVAGWVNLLLMSSSGPIKIPVGACATALQSVEIACDTLLSGKAKVMIAGGFDDFSEEGSYEFANMKATSNSTTEFAMGREPNEFSRPTTSTRAGFMEAQGTGVQILMTASTAIKMGAAIRGIVAFTSTSTDKAGRSIPAPGRGVLTIARELTPSTPLPLLDVKYRTRQLAFRRKQIAQWAENERLILEEEAETCKSEATKEFIAARLANIEEEAKRQEKEALATYGMLQGADPRIAPLRRALAVWGLNADDIGVISIHGTSTKANDKNETHVYNDIFKTLQRTPGNAVPVIAQKNLTGHPKGGAAAWMFIGVCQSIATGVVPGNRNADNIDIALRQFEYLMFPSKTIHTDGICAGLMTSFGFGQVGGSALILHPRYLLGSLDPAQYEAYRVANRARCLASYKVMSEMMITNSLVKIKDHPPFTPELEGAVLLNPLARVTRDKAGELSFPPKLTKAPSVDLANVTVLTESLNKAGDSAGVGVDHELISAVPSDSETFVERNFTDDEIRYCKSQPNPAASFAARWAGKEAVFKSLGVASKGAGAAMKDIEILPDDSGVPQVRLHGSAQAAASSKKITKVQISLSHSETMAIAFAQATF